MDTELNSKITFLQKQINFLEHSQCGANNWRGKKNSQTLKDNADVIADLWIKGILVEKRAKNGMRYLKRDNKDKTKSYINISKIILEKLMVDANIKLQT